MGRCQLMLALIRYDVPRDAQVGDLGHQHVDTFITAAAPPEGRCLSPRRCDSVMNLSPPFAASQHVVSWNHSKPLARGNYSAPSGGELLMASPDRLSP